MSGFRSVRYSNARDRHKMQFEYRRRFGIRMLTVFSPENWSAAERAAIMGYDTQPVI
jgi:hypothetical protein